MTDRDVRTERLSESRIDAKFVPWRGEWDDSGTPAEDECVLCALATADDDRNALVVARSAESYVALNLEPYGVGHVMVVPDDHEAGHHHLTTPATVDHALTLRATVDAIARAFDPDGFNTGTNVGRDCGGSVDGHLHTHVIPRWRNDTDFLPIVGGTSLVEGSLLEMYDEAHRAFAGGRAADGTTETGAVRLAHPVGP